MSLLCIILLEITCSPCNCKTQAIADINVKIGSFESKIEEAKRGIDRCEANIKVDESRLKALKMCNLNLVATNKKLETDILGIKPFESVHKSKSESIKLNKNLIKCNNEKIPEIKTKILMEQCEADGLQYLIFEYVSEITNLFCLLGSITN